jgi:hypothetical protein
MGRMWAAFLSLQPLTGVSLWPAGLGLLSTRPRPGLFACLLSVIGVVRDGCDDRRVAG